MKAKVYYDMGRRVQIGPLGYWKVGDAVGLEDGRAVHVGSVDLDGMAIAWTETHLTDVGDGDWRVGLHKLRMVRSGHHGTLNDAQQQQCRNIAAVGRRLRESEEAQAA